MSTHPDHHPNPAIFALLCAAFIVTWTCGCTWDRDTVRRVAQVTSIGSSRARVKRRSDIDLKDTRHLWAAWTGYGEEPPGDRTKTFLRTYALDDAYKDDPQALLAELRLSTHRQPDLESLHVLAELSLLQGRHGRLQKNEKYAGQMYATAVTASYQYLFDPEFENQRNIYDPLFRQVCDIYNQALEGMLRIMREQDALRPDGGFVATSLDGRPLVVSIAANGRWANDVFDRFEFVSDYSTEGVRNVHVTYGLGVPLIALRASSENQKSDEKFYPQGLSIPLTAFVKTSLKQDLTEPEDRFEIQLLDPLEQTDVNIGGRVAPLESDITTPLAYYLDDPLLDTRWFATAALLSGDFAQKFGGLYMVEPFDPEKIPVVMVHGFWSSPMTWTEMFNDLRADKSLRENYQFWFYLYPSGQPFWYSARQMRIDLAEARQVLDPERKSDSLSEMVLVGHSMGGLISRMQTVNSGSHFWNVVSDRPIHEMNTDDESRERIRETLFFDANPDIARVVTLGTPHRGSTVSNSMTRWISEKLFTMPSYLTQEFEQLLTDDGKFFKSEMLDIKTSTESLSPNSPIFKALEIASHSTKVRFHNVIGNHQPSALESLLINSDEASDGVVSLSSARNPLAVSEVHVDEEHSQIHQHPHTILEVRRILTEHLWTVRGDSVVRPATFRIGDRE